MGSQPWRPASYVRAPAALPPGHGAMDGPAVHCAGFDDPERRTSVASRDNAARPSPAGPRASCNIGVPSPVLPAQVAESLALQSPGASACCRLSAATHCVWAAFAISELLTPAPQRTAAAACTTPASGRSSLCALSPAGFLSALCPVQASRLPHSSGHQVKTGLFSVSARGRCPCPGSSNIHALPHSLRPAASIHPPAPSRWWPSCSPTASCHNSHQVGATSPDVASSHPALLPGPLPSKSTPDALQVISLLPPPSILTSSAALQLPKCMCLQCLVRNAAPDTRAQRLVEIRASTVPTRSSLVFVSRAPSLCQHRTSYYFCCCRRLDGNGTESCRHGSMSSFSRHAR
ncbi:hypothetical protein IQ07DRAFT_604285 [Pyrenochaeta sp. DS3sAY3a]|nr:hypothetical protein IQ07DRAFT_604285 [Pyrenochaeta sp. DS3sAY3a]